MSENTKVTKLLKDFGEDAREVVGVKVTVSKKTGNKYYTYYCLANFTNYDVDNAEILSGSACESVGSSTDLGLVVGDIVEFNYGKAIGDYQPVKSVSMLQPGAFREPK